MFAVVPKVTYYAPGGMPNGSEPKLGELNDIFKDSPGDTSSLESRLEDWMRSVDQRLERLLEVSGRTPCVEPLLPLRNTTYERLPTVTDMEAVDLEVDKVSSGLDCSEKSPKADTEKMPSAKSEKQVTWSQSFDTAPEDLPQRKFTLEKVGRKLTSEKVAEIAATILPQAKSSRSINGEKIPEMPPQRKAVDKVITARRMVSGKLQTKWKLEMERKLGAHHIQKTTTMALRKSDLHKDFFAHIEAVEKANETESPFTVERLVLSDTFDYVISSFLVLNAVLIGVEVEWDANSRERPAILLVIEWACSTVFALELLLRAIGRGRELCAAGERFWAVCDSILVSFSLVDLLFIILPGEAGSSVADVGSSGRLLKIMRMFRILRLLRMVRFLSELRVMAHMIQHSMMSLFWLFSLLTILIYIFSIVLTQGATEFLKHENDEVVAERYGTLFTTMYTLFQAMSGGVSWGDVTTPLMKVGKFYFLIAMVYVFFSIFSVLNIVTGVFVDGAIELAKQDRSMIVTKRIQSRDASAQHLAELLREMDTDGNDTLTQEEFKASLERKDVAEYLDALSVDSTEAELLFMLLDKDGDGCVDIEEFVAGMQKLQGEAKSFDIHLLMHANRQVLYMCSGMLDLVRQARGESGPIDAASKFYNESSKENTPKKAML